MFKTAVFAFILSFTLGAQTTVRFSIDPSDAPTGAFGAGPFPSDVLTVPDATRSTGVRINLPSSEDSCDSESSPVCSNNALLNQLDGFSINPRLMVCFSSPVDTTTLPSGIGFVSLPGGAAISINQVIYDPSSNCAFAKPNNVLDQAGSYLLLVSSAVHDAAGKAVSASADFTSCIGGVEPNPYCTTLAKDLAGKNAPGGGTVVAAALFTTMDATAWLETARRSADILPPLVIPAGYPFSFAVSQLKAITWVPDQSGLPPQNIPVSALSNVAAISFGLYFSPNYLESAIITGAPTAPLGYNTVSFHVFTPAVASRGAKIPVVIFGHGLSDNQFGAPTYIASTLAKNGFATVAIELPGHGYGPAGIVNLTANNGSVSTVFTPGRGVAASPGATIGSTDGCIALGPVGVRDCGRQAAVDLATLVHVILSTGGLGLNLDPSRIYYVGQSFGATIGTLFHAVEPVVSTAVLSGAGGTSTDIARLAVTGRPLGLEFLASLNDPALFNVADGEAPPEEYFHDEWNDNYVFRGQPPVTNEISGAMAIQAAFEAPDWLGMLGDPLAFAPHLRKLPLSGIPVKNTLFQFGFGDLEVPNPTESAVVRAAGGRGTTSFLQFELAAGQVPLLLAVEDPAYPGLPILPHRVLTNPTIFTPGNGAELSLTLADQQQAADFLRANGRNITDPNQYLTLPFTPSERLFETPLNTLPEGLNFLQIPK